MGKEERLDDADERREVPPEYPRSDDEAGMKPAERHSMAAVPSEFDADADVYHYQFDTDRSDPTVDIARVVAELEGNDPEELSALYATVGSLVGQLFSNPPGPESDARLEFSYEGYRVTLEQDGRGTFHQLG